MEKKSLKRRIFAGGSIFTMAMGLVIEGHTQFKGVKEMATLNAKNIAVIQTVDQYQEKRNNLILKKLDVIESDIKALLLKE